MVEQNRSGSYTQIVYAPSGAKLALMGGQSLVKAFIRLPGQATAVYTSSGLDHYRHSDWLGSARLTSSTSQSYASSVAYAPFGETYAQSGTADPSFTGQNPDTTPGDYDFLAREYSIQGRWPSPDPAGLASADPGYPQSWNRYAYVLNNPLNLIDPSGLSPDQGLCIVEPCGGGSGGAAGDCTIDGIDVPCSLAGASVGSGAAAICPNNDCTGITGVDQSGNFIGPLYMPNGWYSSNCGGPYASPNCSPFVFHTAGYDGFGIVGQVDPLSQIMMAGNGGPPSWIPKGLSGRYGPISGPSSPSGPGWAQGEPPRILPEDPENYVPPNIEEMTLEQRIKYIILKLFQAKGGSSSDFLFLASPCPIGTLPTYGPNGMSCPQRY